MLKGRRTKHWMRLFYSLQAAWKLKKASLKGSAYEAYYQAGKSVAGVKDVEPVAAVVRRFAQAAERALTS